MKKNKIKVFSCLSLAILGVSSISIISSCSSTSNDLNEVKIHTNKTNYNENDMINISSTISGNDTNEKDVKYQWYVKKASSDFKPLSGQTNKNLVIRAKKEYDNAVFKLMVTLNSQSLESNKIAISIVNDIPVIPPEPPVQEGDFFIKTLSNRVNIGSGITFNAIFNVGDANAKIDWFIQKNNSSWTNVKAEVNDILSFIITDNSFNNAKVKAVTTINNQRVESNEIKIIVDNNYVAPVVPPYQTPENLIPPQINEGRNETRKFPYDVKNTLIKNIKINGKEQTIEKLKVYGDTFTVFFEEKKNFNVEIELNKNYHEYGVNMGFKNPTVSFYKTTFNSGMQVVDDGNFNKVVNIQPLSVNQPTHFVKVYAIVQEEGYKSQEFEININFKNTFINSMVENEDYFIINNNFVVNPYTQNESIKNKYGNVPLPIVKNGKFVDPKADIDKEDLFNMFHLIVSQRWTPLMNFGSRKIWSEFFVDTFIEWLIKNWKYYPNLNFNNPKLYFTTNYPNWFFDQYRLNSIYEDPRHGVDLTFYGYDTMVKNEYDPSRGGLKISEFLKNHYEAKDIYMTEIKNFNLAERMTFSSKDQDKFIEGVGMFFANYVRPGMSDKDKVFAVNMFVSDWLAYNGKASQDPYGFWTNHNGVCANYGGIAAYLLNILDVPAIPVVTGDLADNPVNMLHMNTWIYIDADGKGKKWYMQDATNIDESATTSIWPGSRFMGKANKNGFDFKLLLTDVYNNKYGDYDWDEQTQAKLEYIVYHNNFFNYFGAQWFRPYLQNEVSFGSYNIKNESWMVNEYDQNKPLSKPAFHDGYWYFFNQNKRFVRTKIVGTRDDVMDLTDNIPGEFLNKITGNKYGSINAAQHGKYIFISTFSQYDYGPDVFQKDEEKWFIVHDLTDLNWKNSKLLKLDNEMPIQFSGNTIPLKRTGFTTYFFDEKVNLNLELIGPGANKHRESKIMKINIFNQWPEQLKGLDIGQLETISKFDSHGQIIEEGDDNIAYQYFTTIGNASGILAGVDSNISPNQKIIFNEELKNILKSNSLTANEKAIKMKQIYDNMVKSSYNVEISNTLIRNLSNDLYQLEERYFNESYGILFDIKDGFDSFESLGLEQQTGATRYNIWYSANKDGNYELLAKNLYEPRIAKEYFKNGKNPTGYYYVQYYTLNNPNNYKYSQRIKVVVEKSMFSNLPIMPSFEIWKYDASVSNFLKHHSTSSNYNKFNTQWSHVPYQLRMKSGIPFFPNEYNWLKIKLNHINKNGVIKTETIATITTTNQKIDWIKDLGLINSENAGAYFMNFEYDSKDGNKYNLYSNIYYMLEYDDIVKNNFSTYKMISDKIIEISKKND